MRLGCQYCLFQLIGMLLYALPRIVWFMLRQVVGAYILSLVALFRGLPETAERIAEYCLAQMIEHGVPVQNFELWLVTAAQAFGYLVIIACWIFTALSTVEIIRLILWWAGVLQR